MSIETNIAISAAIRGHHGDDENRPEEHEAVEDGGTPEQGSGATDNPTDAPTGGAGIGAADNGFGGFASCRAKYGISAEEAISSDNEFSGSPFGNSPDGKARQRASEAGLSQDADPEEAGTNDSRATPAACRDIPEDAPESLKISKYFTVASFCSHAVNYQYACKAQSPRVAGVRTNLTRAAVICNLRHLATNIMDPLMDHFRPLGWQIRISSGFRHGTGGSDHYAGSAADLIFEHKNIGRAKGKNLVRIQKVIDQVLKLPYTQMIGEADQLLHIACRRNGKMSGTRLYWSYTYGPYSGPGYRHKVGIDDGNPPVR